MAKPEWGVKRLCQSCATKFYDLRRSPIACPQCGARFDPEALLKSRRSRPTAATKPAKPPASAPAADKPKADKPGADKPEADKPEADKTESPDKSSAEPGEEDQSPKDTADDDDDVSVIQDTSELGGDAELSDVAVTGGDKED